MRNPQWSIAVFIAGVLALPSCEQEESLDVPASEEAVKEIVEELEKNPEVSEFTQALKEASIQVESDELTVFAVRNKPARAEAGGSVERQVVVGRYSQDQLKSGMFLYTVDKDSLLVEKNDTATLLNGIALGGAPQTVGNSFVYVIPEYFPKYEEQPQPEFAYELQLKVWRANDTWSPDFSEEGFPKEGVQVIVYEASSTRELGAALDTLTSDKDGRMTFKYDKEDLAYKVLLPDSLSSFYEGYHIMGVFTSQAEADEWARPFWGSFKPGDYKLEDLNGDMLINQEDVVMDEGAYVTFVTFSEENRRVEADAYLVKKESSVKPDYELELKHFMESWDSEGVVDALGRMDVKLSGSPADAVWYAASDSIWQRAEVLLASFDRCNQLFAEAPEEYRNEWLEQVVYGRYAVERLFIYTLLNQYYKGVPVIDAERKYSSREEGVAYLQNELEVAMERMPASERGALYMCMARLCLSIKQDERAYEACRRVEEEMPVDSAGSVFVLGKYRIQQEDCWLAYAEAALNTGRIIEAVQHVNRIYEKYGLPPYLPSGISEAEIRSAILRIYSEGVNGVYYPNGRMMKYAETSRFKTDKYRALPFPEWVLEQCANIKQNEGW